MKIALLGGSFNPVHIGHLALADEVRASLGYDRVILVPANIPPHKTMSGGASAADRLAMLELAVSGVEWLGVEDCEIARGGISYTIDTIRFIARKYADVLEGNPGFIFGHDLVAGFSSWREPDAIAAESDIILARRPDDAGLVGAQADGDLPSGFFWRHVTLSNPLLPISSSRIRSAIAAKKGWRYLVPDPVYRYIVEHHLYEH